MSIIDLYEGEMIQVWTDEDEEEVFISFPFVTINMPTEIYEDLLKEMSVLVSSCIKKKE